MLKAEIRTGRSDRRLGWSETSITLQAVQDASSVRIVPPVGMKAVHRCNSVSISGLRSVGPSHVSVNRESNAKFAVGAFSISVTS
jgi:hypothetical protein